MDLFFSPDTMKELSEKHSLPLTLTSTATRGLHLQLSVPNKKLLKDFVLPAEFIQVQKIRSGFSFTTYELQHASDRCQEVLREIHSISNVVVFRLLADIRTHIGCLYKLCENIVLTDVLLSLAHISCISNYVRPRFANLLDLKRCRHPMLDFICRTEPVANDVSASSSYNFHFITGPNMSGKSIYIRQIALLQIMAQMKEMMYIKQALTPSSLVIVDEPCRGTSREEGTAIAWAVFEEMMCVPAFFFVTTHFLFLTKLADFYPSVTNHYLEVEEDVTAQGRSRLVYTHRLLSGMTRVQHYGLRLAESVCVPRSVVQEAVRLAHELDRHARPEPATVATHEDARALYRLAARMQLLREGSGLLTSEMCRELREGFDPGDPGDPGLEPQLSCPERSGAAAAEVPGRPRTV
ncbi:mutS protein homolog 4-like isoform X2 [Bacillus rossius redtenbacheri]|uniref:mutS protein homolog 4-like isoform X2 n=1 Tax=Bacillus rossius redtenbacheri TaxID=93214 RepID=UPI002FDEB496